MTGAIAGDIIGSVFEETSIKTKDFPLWNSNCRFTDDTVLTIAVASSLLTKESYFKSIREFGMKYPDAGYGRSFNNWLNSSEPKPYNSWGNGSAMRVTPIGYAFNSLETVLQEAEKSAVVTHNHPEGVKGAQAVACAVFLARTSNSKETIRRIIGDRFGYNLTGTVTQIRQDYSFDVSCQGSVPEAITAFLDSTSFEDALRNAVSLGGDSDTLACIAGGIAEAFYGSIPANIRQIVNKILPSEFLDIIEAFRKKFV